MVTSLLNAKAWRAKYLTCVAHQRAMSTQRTAVVVGATSGIGEACAHRLAEQGFLVVAVGRDRPGRADAVVQALTEKSTAALLSNNNDQPQKPPAAPLHEFYPCNAFSLRSVQETAQKIQKKHPRIDALVMTQGMATTQGFTPTASEGNDEKLTLHYYSRMCMIQSLLPALKASDMPAVVVSILSGGIHSAYSKYQEDPSLKNSYSIKNAADAAGYYNDLGLDHFALALKTIRFVHASPGFVNTNWGTEFHPVLRGLVRLLQPAFGKSAADCAELLMGSTVLAADAGDSLPARPKRTDGFDNKSGGVYIVGQYGATAALTKEHTPEARDSIWAHTKEVLKKAGVTVE